MSSLRALAARTLLAPFTRRLKTVRHSRLAVELLEARDNPAPLASINGLASQNILLGENAAFGFTFTNAAGAGAGNTGYAPFIELAADTSGPDGATSLPTDGYGTPTVTAAGLTLTPAASILLTTGQTTFTNPLTGEVRPVPAGFGNRDTVYVYALPFGSFTPGQSTAMSVSMPTSNLADRGTGLPIAVTGGYRDDAPSLAGPGFYGVTGGNNTTNSPDTALAIPELYRFRKVYLGPENETATGPNFVRRYRLEVDIATGQTLNAVTLTDDLANTMQIVGRTNARMAAFLAASGLTTNVFSAASSGGTAVTTAPDGTVSYNFGSVTGVAGLDAAFEFDFFIPRDDAGGTQVLPQTPASGTDSNTAQNTASTAATWTPLDFTANGRDGQNINVGKGTPDNGPHTLEQHSLAVQKSVEAIDPATGNVVSGGVVRPGSTLLRYTLNFQVSDYYAFDDVFLRDVMGDGQRLFLGTRGVVTGFPTLDVTNAYLKGSPNGSRTNTGGVFAGSGVIDYQRRYTSGNVDSDPTSFPADGPTSGVFTTLGAAPDTDVNTGGRTFLQFNVSDELRARLGANAGLLVGGEIGNDGSGPGSRAFGSQLFGGTTGTIVFYAEVTREFSDAFPSGDQSVDQGDILRNFADDPTTGGRDGVVGTQLNPATINAANPTAIGTGTDDSGSSIVIPYGQQEKQIYAINSQAVPPAGFNDPPLSLQPGDRVTYRLTYTLPISSFESLRLIDLPPLPVMDVDDSGPFNFIRNPAAYGYLPGQVGVEGTDTYFSTFDPGMAGGRNPSVSMDSQNNSVTMNFGSNDDTQRRSTTLSLLVTFVVGNQPFASDLFLTNQLRVAEGSTNAGDTTVEDLRRFELVRPFLSVQKGTAAGNSTGFTVGSGVNQITFGGTNVALPGMGGSVGGTVVNRNSAALSGTNALYSSGQATSIGGQNIGTGNAPVDAADTVRYAVVAQNSGKGDAFDVTISDTIQAEYDRAAFDPATNLRVIRGDGTVLTAGVDYTISYNSGTGRFDIDLIDSYTAGNVGGASEDNRSGALSRGERTTTGGDVDITNGSNTVIVLYDVTLLNTVTPNQLITNVAAVTKYANSEGGGDLTDPAVVPGASDPTDDATVRTRLPLVQKTLVGTEVTTAGNNAANQAVVGELVTYTVTVTVPEGSTPGATIIDSLQAGLAFVDVTAVSTSAGLTVAGLPTLGDTPLNTTIGSNGRVVTFNLGTITNSNTNNAAAETITITYRAVVLNVNAGSVNNATNQANNQSGQTRNNSADFEWTGNAATLPGVPAGRATDLNGALTGTATPVTVVEPTITNAKDVAVQNAGIGAYSAFGQTVRADAGDNIRYRIRMINPVSGSTRANDVTLSDQLPTAAFAGGTSAFSVFSVSVTGAGTVYRNGVARTLDATDFAIDGAGLLTLNLAFNYDIDPDVQIDLVVQGTNFLGSTGSGVTNLADVRWTSLDGTPGQRSVHNTNSVERTGADGEINGGALNDYRDTDNAVIESPPVVRKDLVATSEGHTSGTTVAVGEVVRYRVYVSVPEGNAANFQVQDFLPTGLSFLNDGTARWAFVSTGGNVIGSASITNVTGLGTPGVGTGGIDGNQATLATLTSGQIIGTFADNNISTASAGAGTGEAAIYANGADVYFRFGDLSNSDNDTDIEYVVIEFNALVLNVAANQAGVTRSNSIGVLVDTDGNGTAGYIDVVADTNGDGTGSGEATVTANDPANNGSGTAAQSNAVVVTVVEPAVAVAKSVIGATTGDPGDTVTFEIVLTAGSGANTSTAFDVAFADLVPGGFENVAFVGGSLSSTGTVTGLGSVGVAGNNVSLAVGSMAPGATVTFRFTATINDNGVAAPAPGSTLTNTGSVTWTGLPGSAGTTSNTTGTDTPGAAGSGTGERTGADGIGGALNDYAAADPADVTLNSHSLAGQVYSDANNNGIRDGVEALITGQTIRFRLTGTDTAGNAVDQTVTTSTGVYSFTSLRAGTYVVTQLDQATGYLDGRDTPGTSSPGTAFGGTGTVATADRGTPTSPLRDADAIATIVIGGGASSKAGINYNFGELLPAQLGNLVFLDQNGNGRQDGGTEVGIDGVRVVLTGTDDTGRAVNVTASTAAGGLYQFGNLRPGSYTATFGTSDGTTTYARTVRDSAVATDATDSDGDAATGTTGGYTLAAGDSNQTVDQGLYVPVSLGNRVFFDQNADGVQDANEAGLPGAGIEVVWLGADGGIGGGDDLTFNTVTGANGVWTVGNLPPGNYRVTVTPPAGGPWTLTDSLDNAALNASGVVNVSTPSGVNRTDIDFGYRGTGSIGDTVFLDIDNDGVADTGEGIQNVVVTLTADVDGNGTAETFTATTNTNGFYQFANLPFNTPAGTPITYTVTVNAATLPPGVTQTFDPDAVTNNSSTSVLTAGTPSDQTRDFGYRGPGSIGDTVWLDVNGNNTFDPGEGIANVVVRLIGDFDNSGDTETVTATTDTNGFYQFTGLVVNNGVGGGKTYTVDVDETTLPATVNATPVVDPQGALDGTATSTLSTGSPTDQTRDFAYRGVGSIGDTVWLDVNGNNTFDPGEGIAGVRVTLTGDLDGDGTQESVATTTDTNGQYLFAGLRVTAGGVPYTVAVNTATLPTGVTQTFDPDGTLDSTAVATLTTVTTSNLTRDFAYRGPGRIGDRVFNDINNNGVYDAGEGLDGVTVTLTGDLDNDGVNETVTTTTSGDGFYLFDGLVVDGDNGVPVVPKTYTVSVIAATLPPTLAQTVDPDATLNNQSDSTLSPSALIDLTRDFGYRGPGSIGDTIFLDVNNNGLPSSGEGIANVVVRLIGDFDGDGTAETVTATTDTNGQYLFSGLRTSVGGVTYTVDVDETTLPATVNTTPTSDPQGPADGTATATLTTAAPTDPTRDFGYRGVGAIGDTVFLDVNNSGAPDASEGLAGVRVFLSGDLDGDGTVETVTTTTNASGVYQFTGLRTTPAGVTYTVTVDTTTVPQDGPGQPIPNTVDPDGGVTNTSAVVLTDAAPSNQAQDFGYRNTTSGVIGDTVFLDVDGDGVADPGEGITGVRVRLSADIDGNGTTETFTLTTNATGTYRFENLPVRDPFGTLIQYTVTVDTTDLPQGVTNTTDPDGGADSTSTLTLDPNSPVNLNQDFGYRGDGSIGDEVFLDLNNNGRWDAGEGITGVTVVLTADVNGDGVQDLTVTATTGPDGEYLFDNLPVDNRNEAPINYTVRVTGGLPTGVSNTVDPDATTDSTWTGTLATGPAAPDRRDIDFGYRGTGRLGDRVWLDANGDGVQDPITSEPSLPNVGFTLTYAGQDGAFGNADDITTTVTGDVNGAYQFGHLPAGTFRVTVNTATLPANVTPTFDLDGTGTPHAADATLTTGQARTDVDFGYRGAAGLGDRVWLDQNRNNLQDPGEGGIPGGVVELRMSGADGVLGTADDLLFTATTAANGIYTFAGLPVYSAGGDPFRVNVQGLPAGGLDVVGDLDSPAGSGDSTAAGVLGANQTRTDVDFGYAGRGAIRGVVFEDVNNDGVQQPGDPAIPGTVLVLEGTDVFGNPILDPLSGGPLTVTADANGRYAFTNLPPGTYTVREAQPAGYLDGTDTPGSLGGLAGRGAADADRIAQIVLPVDGNAVENNFAEIRPAAVAGTVYEDRNNNGRQDPSEPGIPGVRVVLTGTDDRGPVALTLTTDANGNYSFPNLRPGTYTLTQTQPVLFAQGQNTVGTGGGALGATDVIQTIVLAPGQSAIAYRFGEIVRQVSPTPTLAVEAVQPWETSKRMFLSSSTAVATASVPDFAALGSVNTTRPIQFTATGDGDGGSRVRVYDMTNGRERFRFDPFPGFLGGVRTAVGDLTGDGIPDIVAAAGPGGGPHVIIYNGDTGAVVQSFFAFEEAFRGGSFVAVGDFDGDGTADLAVAADRGGGPRVRVFKSGNPAWVMADFWGIEDMNFRGGARVAAGDVNGDGRTDLVVGAGADGGPRIAVYNGYGIAVGHPYKVVGDFFAFEPSFTGGVYLAVADLDGDGFAEVITGAGEGGGPRVRSLSGRELTAGRVTTVTDQFVFDPAGNIGGARVAATDLDGDGLAELFVGTGPGVRPVARFFNPRTGAPLNTFSPDWENVVSGVFVG